MINNFEGEPLKPPLEGIPEEEEVSPPKEILEGVEAKPGKPGWIPLKPVAVMPALEVKNELLAVVTKSEIEFWSYTPQERSDIEEIISTCGITAPAWLQLIGAIAVRDAAKFAELRITKRRGLKEKEGGVGSTPPERK